MQSIFCFLRSSKVFLKQNSFVCIGVFALCQSASPATLPLSSETETPPNIIDCKGVLYEAAAPHLNPNKTLSNKPDTSSYVATGLSETVLPVQLLESKAFKTWFKGQYGQMGSPETILKTHFENAPKGATPTKEKVKSLIAEYQSKFQPGEVTPNDPIAALVTGMHRYRLLQEKEYMKACEPHSPTPPTWDAALGLPPSLVSPKAGSEPRLGLPHQTKLQGTDGKTWTVTDYLGIGAEHFVYKITGESGEVFALKSSNGKKNKLGEQRVIRRLGLPVTHMEEVGNGYYKVELIPKKNFAQKVLEDFIDSPTEGTLLKVEEIIRFYETYLASDVTITDLKLDNLGWDSTGQLCILDWQFVIPKEALRQETALTPDDREKNLKEYSERKTEELIGQILLSFKFAMKNREKIIEAHTPPGDKPRDDAEWRDGFNILQKTFRKKLFPNTFYPLPQSR